MGKKVNTIMNDSRAVVPFVSLRNQRGSAAVDYAVIVVLTVLAVIAVIVSIEDRGDVIFRSTTTVIGDFGSIKAE